MATIMRFFADWRIY